MKRILSIILALALLTGVMPLAVFAENEKTVETSFNVTYNPSMVITTTRLTGREVSEMLKYSVTSLKGTDFHGEDQGWFVYVTMDSNSAYTSLGYFEYDSFRSLALSDEHLTADREYYYEFNIENAGDYLWDVDNLPTVTVNGEPADVRWRNQNPYGDLDVFVKAPLNETGHAAAAVTVTPETTVVQRGTQKQFAAEVLGTTNEVSWSVFGNSSAATAISDGGLLTVAADETAETLTIKTYSRVSPAFAQATVTLIDEEVRIDSVSLDLTDAVAPRGSSVYIEATVTGTDIHDLDWELTGENIDSSTCITPYSDQSARLDVSANQEETLLTVTARSVADPTKYAVAKITVTAANKIPASLNIEYDAAQVNLTTAMTGMQATQALRDALITTHGTDYTTGDPWFIYSNATPEDGDYTSLVYFKEGEHYTSLYISGDPLTLDKQYYFWFNVENGNGWEWDPDNLPTVTVNGKPADIVRWRSHSYSGDLDVFIKVDVTPAGSVAKGDFDFDGEITVADALAALRIAAKLVPETAGAVTVGDVDGDGHVTVADALAILRVAAKLADASSLG